MASKPVPASEFKALVVERVLTRIASAQAAAAARNACFFSVTFNDDNAPTPTIKDAVMAHASMKGYKLDDSCGNGTTWIFSILDEQRAT